MAEMTVYEHGAPSWVDLGTTDVAGGLRFYTELFGWDSQDLGEEAGHYTMLTKEGRLIAAMSTATDPGPPRWTTYINVDDIKAVAERVEAAGGKVVFGPMDVMTAGKMLILSDPTGAFLAAWQAGDHKGAQLLNEPGALAWTELSTSDLGRAKAFYGDVFGWAWGGGPEYSEAEVAGRAVAGAMPRPEQLPAEVPDHWLVYFGTADVDGDAERAQDLGATLQAGPMDIPGTGRFAVLTDPQGAAFALYQAEAHE
jgi:predicted enzyme related to lactoylglutathione lyase